MKTWINKNLTRRMIAPVMAIALAMSLATYEFAKPAFAKGPIAAPTAMPLDDLCDESVFITEDLPPHRDVEIFKGNRKQMSSM